MSIAELAFIFTLGAAAVLITCIARLVLWEQASWLLWRRWRIYCPSYPVSHLFGRAAAFQFGLMDYDEAFVSPCTLNEINVGGVPGRWTPKIMFMSMEMPEEDYRPGELLRAARERQLMRVLGMKLHAEDCKCGRMAGPCSKISTPWLRNTPIEPRSTTARSATAHSPHTEET